MRPVSIVLPVLIAAVVVGAVLTFSRGNDSSRAHSGTSASIAAGNEKIDISDFAYSPASVTVKLGTTITFMNEESVEHTATSDTEGAFDTGTLHKGQAAHFKLNKVGIYSYHCSFHPFMHGTIKVVR
jgi:plastocyanin